MPISQMRAHFSHECAFLNAVAPSRILSPITNANSIIFPPWHISHAASKMSLFHIFLLHVTYLLHADIRHMYRHKRHAGDMKQIPAPMVGWYTINLILLHFFTLNTLINAKFALTNAIYHLFYGNHIPYTPTTFPSSS